MTPQDLPDDLAQLSQQLASSECRANPQLKTRVMYNVQDQLGKTSALSIVQSTALIAAAIILIANLTFMATRNMFNQDKFDRVTGPTSTQQARQNRAELESELMLNPGTVCGGE